MTYEYETMTLPQRFHLCFNQGNACPGFYEINEQITTENCCVVGLAIELICYIPFIANECLKSRELHQGFPHRSRQPDAENEKEMKDQEAEKLVMAGLARRAEQKKLKKTENDTEGGKTASSFTGSRNDVSGPQLRFSGQSSANAITFTYTGPVTHTKNDDTSPKVSGKKMPTPPIKNDSTSRKVSGKEMPMSKLEKLFPPTMSALVMMNRILEYRKNQKIMDDEHKRGVTVIIRDTCYPN